MEIVDKSGFWENTTMLVSLLSKMYLNWSGSMESGHKMRRIAEMDSSSLFRCSMDSGSKVVSKVS